MNGDERRARGRRLCRIIHKRVARVASQGLGLWSEAWEIVEEPSTRFLDLLMAWEDSGSERDRDALEAAAHAVVNAWKEVDRRYREAGCPGAHEIGKHLGAGTPQVHNEVRVLMIQNLDDDVPYEDRVSSDAGERRVPD